MILGRGRSPKQPRSRLTLERLEDRCLLSFPEFPFPGPTILLPGLTSGPPSVLQHQHSPAADGGAAADSTSGLVVPNPPPRDPRAATVRKDQSTLTDTERSDFVNAVLALKSKFEDGSTTSVYDEFVLIHQAAMRNNDIHVGPAFFPWHRALLDLFERELQTINPNVTIPYWNWAVDGQTDSPIWNSDFMGGDGDPTDNYAVKTGPFRQGQWTLITDGPDLRRSFGVWVSSLPTAADEDAALTIANYDVAPYDTGVDPADSFRNFMTGWNSPTSEPERHNRVHNWVGGSMLTDASPNDPIFWLVHANLDRIWANWESAHGYLYPASGAPPGENLTDQMFYLGGTPKSVLDLRFLGYRYDTEQRSPNDRGSEPGSGASSGSNSAGGPGDQNTPILVHAAQVGPGPVFHQHGPKSGDTGAASVRGLLQVPGDDGSLASGHAGHVPIAGIAGSDFPHSGSDAGHAGAPGLTHAGAASMAHASAMGEHGPG
jgi:tyrosinase